MNNISTIKITKSQVMRLSENLKMLLHERHESENGIARALDIPVMTVRRIVSGETTDPRISTLKLLADYFSVTVDSLVGDNPNSISMSSKNIPQFIPVLDWKTAAIIKSMKDINLKSWQEWHPVIMGDNSSLSANAFALGSRPSMQPRFPMGTLFIIDPNETSTDGDTVLIKMKPDGDLSLRKLIIDLPKWQLQPLISGSEVLFYDENQHHIVGVVILSILHNRKEK